MKPRVILFLFVALTAVLCQGCRGIRGYFVGRTVVVDYASEPSSTTQWLESHTRDEWYGAVLDSTRDDQKWILGNITKTPTSEDIPRLIQLLEETDGPVGTKYLVDIPRNTLQSLATAGHKLPEARRELRRMIDPLYWKDFKFIGKQKYRHLPHVYTAFGEAADALFYYGWAGCDSDYVVAAQAAIARVNDDDARTSLTVTLKRGVGAFEEIRNKRANPKMPYRVNSKFRRCLMRYGLFLTEERRRAKAAVKAMGEPRLTPVPTNQIAQEIIRQLEQEAWTRFVQCWTAIPKADFGTARARLAKYGMPLDWIIRQSDDKRVPSYEADLEMLKQDMINLQPDPIEGTPARIRIFGRKKAAEAKDLKQVYKRSARIEVDIPMALNAAEVAAMQVKPDVAPEGYWVTMVWYDGAWYWQPFGW